MQGGSKSALQFGRIYRLTAPHYYQQIKSQWQASEPDSCRQALVSMGWFYVTWVACTSGDGKRKWKIFSKSAFPPPSLILSRRDSLHLLSIVLCTAAASAFVALQLSKAAAAVAPVSSLFLLAKSLFFAPALPQRSEAWRTASWGSAIYALWGKSQLKHSQSIFLMFWC